MGTEIVPHKRLRSLCVSVVRIFIQREGPTS